MTMTRAIENPTPGAPNPKKTISAPKKKASVAKHSIDIVKEAAEKLRTSHIYASATNHSAQYDKKCKKFMDEYIASLTHSAELLGLDLLKMVPSP